MRRIGAGSWGYAGMVLCWTCWTCLLLVGNVRTQEPSPTRDDTAFMDTRESPDQPGMYGCGDIISNTISGTVSSLVPIHSPDFNCTLQLASTPGTRLSLSFDAVRLPSPNLNTCDGNRLKILSSGAVGSRSLLASFPNGLCGYAKPSQTIVSPDNRVYLVLETVSSGVEIQFTLSYTAFKSTSDGDCFECNTGDSSTFCIDRSLLCDSVQNCPGDTEETNQNCRVTTMPPPASGDVLVIVIVSVLIFLFIAVIGIVILTLLAKRMYSKPSRLQGRRPSRVSQSGRMRAESAPIGYGSSEHGLSLHGRDAACASDIQMGRLPVASAHGMPAAPPPYSTLPRATEHSLQIAENTNPKSRSRLTSAGSERNLSSP